MHNDFFFFFFLENGPASVLPVKCSIKDTQFHRCEVDLKAGWQYKSRFSVILGTRTETVDHIGTQSRLKPKNLVSFDWADL